MTRDAGHYMSSDSEKGLSRLTAVKVGVGVVLFFGGLGSSLAQTDTEYEAEQTLSDLRIKLTSEPNVVKPDVYDAPPKVFEQIVGGASEWKLSYFCKHHTSDSLKQIIHEQFATKLFDKKGNETKLVDYTVSSNPATNHLIVRCPAREDAQSVLEVLEVVDVPPIQVKIDCLISEVYADMTFDRETTIAIENLFGESITLKPGGTAFGADVQDLVREDEFLPAFPGASIREVARARMGLNVGFLEEAAEGHSFTVLIDLLESRGYLKILMNPTLEVVNGGTAEILSSQHVPIDRTVFRSAESDLLETKTEYEDVIDSLKVTAHVFADSSIGLETDVVLGSKNTPDGVKQVPIITKKEVTNKQNRIRQGESLIIGGLRKNEDFAVVRGVPILKDIPIIGFLFSSEDTEQRAVETIFVLTPTISTNGRPREEVMSEVRRKHEPESPAGLGEMISDPFGLKAKAKARERSLREAEQSRLEAELKKAQARIDVREANERAERAEAELNRIKAEAEKAIADARKAQAEAEKAREEAEAKSKTGEKNDEKRDSGSSGEEG
jgi:hypothetical protein